MSSNSTTTRSQANSLHSPLSPPPKEKHVFSQCRDRNCIHCRKWRPRYERPEIIIDGVTFYGPEYGDPYLDEVRQRVYPEFEEEGPCLYTYHFTEQRAPPLQGLVSSTKGLARQLRTLGRVSQQSLTSCVKPAETV